MANIKDKDAKAAIPKIKLNDENQKRKSAAITLPAHRETSLMVIHANGSFLEYSEKNANSGVPSIAPENPNKIETIDIITRSLAVSARNHTTALSKAPAFNRNSLETLSETLP